MTARYVFLIAKLINLTMELNAPCVINHVQHAIRRVQIAHPATQGVGSFIYRTSAVATAWGKLAILETLLRYHASNVHLATMQVG